MIIRCNIFKESGFATVNAIDKFLHVSSAVNMHFCFNSSVKFVIYKYAFNTTALVNDTVQLIFRLFIGVPALKCADKPVRGNGGKHVPTIGRNDLHMSGTKKRDILNNNLTTYVKYASKSGSGYRFVLTYQVFYDLGSSFFSRHEYPPILQGANFLRKYQGLAQSVSALRWRYNPHPDQQGALCFLLLRCRNIRFVHDH